MHFVHKSGSKKREAIKEQEAKVAAPTIRLIWLFQSPAHGRPPSGQPCSSSAGISIAEYCRPQKCVRLSNHAAQVMLEAQARYNVYIQYVGSWGKGSVISNHQIYFINFNKLINQIEQILNRAPP